jgi:hypothetical protein
MSRFGSRPRVNILSRPGVRASADGGRLPSPVNPREGDSVERGTRFEIGRGHDEDRRSARDIAWSRWPGQPIFGRLLALTAITLTVLGGFAATSVSSSLAAPIFSGTYPNSFSLGAAGGLKLSTAEGEVGITCKEVSGSGSLTGPAGGNFAATLGGCTAGIFKCEATAGGKAKFEGGFELVQIEPAIVGVVLQPNEFGFLCKVGTDERRMTYRGSILAPISPIKTSTTHFTVSMAQTENGSPQYYECEIGQPVCGEYSHKELHLQEELNASGLWRWTAAVGSLELTTARAVKINK